MKHAITSCSSGLILIRGDSNFKYFLYNTLAVPARTYTSLVLETRSLYLFMILFEAWWSPIPLNLIFSYTENSGSAFDDLPLLRVPFLKKGPIYSLAAFPVQVIVPMICKEAVLILSLHQLHGQQTFSIECYRVAQIWTQNDTLSEAYVMVSLFFSFHFSLSMKLW